MVSNIGGANSLWQAGTTPGEGLVPLGTPAEPPLP